MELCMEKEYFKDEPYITKPNQLKTGFTICSCFPSEKYISGLVKDAANYDMYHGIAYAKKTNDGYQAIAVDTTIDNIDMPNKIINNQKCIIKFLSYLEKELQPAFEKLASRTIELDLLIDQTNNNTKLMNQQQANEEIRIKFLKQIGVISGSLNVSLTKKEKHCLRCYLAGKTAEDTAAELAISRRTVENHIDNIKDKLNCQYKKDLFEKIDLIECLGMLN
jgi:DNA-binding CsgD family transcriptional regulator